MKSLSLSHTHDESTWRIVETTGFTFAHNLDVPSQLSVAISIQPSWTRVLTLVNSWWGQIPSEELYPWSIVSIALHLGIGNCFPHYMICGPYKGPKITVEKADLKSIVNKQYDLSCLTYNPLLLRHKRHRHADVVLIHIPVSTHL